MKVKELQNDGNLCMCTLLFDEMSIAINVSKAGEKTRGYVDVGVNNIGIKTNEYAKNALVLMVVSLTEKWKLPFAYFLINSMNAEQKKNILIEAISRLQQINVKVVCVTCDGPPCNKSVFKKLGAELSINQSKPYFTSSDKPEEKIFTLLDSCHMIKLIRNIFATHKILKSDNGEINFKYIEFLYKLQSEEGFKLSNKIGKAHMQWEKKKNESAFGCPTDKQKCSRCHSVLF